MLVAGRGIAMAYMLRGQYQLTTFIFELCAALLILLLLQSADWLLTKLIRRIFGDGSRLRRFAGSGLRLLVVGLFFGTFLLATVQMHPPKVACRLTPSNEGMDFSTHRVTTDDGVEISAWVIPSGQPNRATIVVAHGLGANKQNFCHIGKLHHELGLNVVMFDFRAHGDSQGHTCTLGIREANDVKAGYDLAVSQFPNQPVYAWSTSMGGAATLRAAAEFDIFDGLVVDATYSSVKSIAMNTKFCYLGPLDSAAWNLSRLWFGAYTGLDIESFGPERDITRIEKPILLIHGTIDSILPMNESRQLHAAANGNTDLWIVDGAGHCGAYLHPEYADRVLAFVQDRSSSPQVVTTGVGLQPTFVRPQP